METAEGLLTACPRGWGWRMEKKDLKFVSFFFGRARQIRRKKNEIASVNRPQIFFSGKSANSEIEIRHRHITSYFKKVRKLLTWDQAQF